MQEPDKPVALVTGSTDGIGNLTARRLAELDWTVLVHGRDPEKVSRVAADIRQASGNPGVAGFTADLASLAAVRRLADAVREDHPRLDVLINNAGVLPAGANGNERHFSDDGYELCLAVNHLAPFLLTRSLIPCLEASPAARILNVSSVAQETVDFDDLMLDTGYRPMRAYARSKLALTMFTMALHERLQDSAITVNCLHPGTLLDTNMVRQAAFRPLGSAASGAEVEVHLATAPELAGVSGVYFDRKTPARAHAQAYDRQARERLWRISLELTGQSDA